MQRSLKDTILHFADFGLEPGGGISRTFGSAAYTQAASAMCQHMAENGMDSWIDPVGNVHGIYRAANANAPVILVGSHLDTVREGGMFDGLLGVLAGVECVRRLREAQHQLACAIHVIATNGEEANDLGGTFGSRCLVGMVDTAAEGFAQRAAKFGLTPKDVQNTVMDFSSVKCYLELHIEQGKTLYETGAEIGIVTGIVGLQRYQIDVQGISNHAGTTMMAYRNDALVGAAKIIEYADMLAREMGDNLVATFGKVAVHPNVVAVISDQVSMVLECRNQDEALMAQYVEHVKEYSARIGSVTITPLVKKAPVQCDPHLIRVMDAICSRAQVHCRQMPSGATHDGNMIALKVPIGMLFVPSRDGISHHKAEWTDWDQCDKGADILYKTILEIGGKS